MSWSVEGSYYEACNCEAVCPCRREGDRRGGRSTYETCDFVLSWMIEAGNVDGRDLSGRKVVMTGFYSDDEEHSPWRVSLVIDQDATDQQFSDLADVFLGRLGGDTRKQFAAAIVEVRGVHRGAIELVHERRKWRIGVDTTIEVRSTVEADAAGPVTCGIPGHQQPGTELIADVITVDLDDFRFDVRSRCSYQSRFAYQG